MKKTFKRALSLLLSVLMVVTMLPSFALTASAATDPNLLAFYFNNSVSAKSVTTNYAGGTDLGAVSEDTLVWNYTENAAELKGNKGETPRVKLSDLLNGKTCNNSTGFTIQFDAKTNMQGWGNFFEISNSTPYNGTGGTGKTYVYLSASSNSGESYKCHSKVALTNGSESSSACSVAVNDNQWHNFRLVIGQGQLYIFVDGKLQSPGLNDSSRINDNLFNELKNNGYLNFGASAYSQSPAYTGYIRNFMFVNNAKLDIAMAKYENKMNGTVYTNMKPAYDAYVLAKKCAEALRYGDFESYPDIETYADNLNTKTDAMQPWTAYTGNYANNLNSSKKVFGDWDSNSNADYKEIYKNILYIPTNGQNAHYAYEGTGKQASDYKMTVRAYFDETILLYDGITKPQFGIALYMDGTSKPWNWGYGGMSLYYAGLTNYNASDATNTTGLQVGGKWRGRDGRLNHTWIYRTKGDSSVGATFVNNSTYYTVGDDSYLANIINYNKPSNITDTWIEITPGFRYGIGADNKKYNEHYGNTDRTIRILNYKKIVDEINTKKSILSTVSEYTQGGLSNVINGFDLATKDPNSYFTSSNNYQSCKTNFEAAVSDLNQNATKDAFFTITAKKDTNAGDTLATFSLSNGCKAKTVQYALNTVTPGNGRTDTYHYDYVWTSNTITDVKANATYIATQAQEAHNDHYIDVDVQKAATCTENGIMNTKCSVCDYASTRVINALGHDMGEYVDDNNGKVATCTEAGYTSTSTRRCKRTGCTYFESTKSTPISALGHSYGDFSANWSDYVDDDTVYTHTRTCSRDANHTETENCSFGEWVVSQDKTTETRECSVCHGSQTREHQADKVTATFKLPNGTIIATQTVDPETEVNAPSLDSYAFNDEEGHHTFSWSNATYTITEDIIITATANTVTPHNTKVVNINFSNVDSETLLATSCDEELTYSYDVKTYCEDCDYVVSQVTTPVSPLAHTQATRNINLTNVDAETLLATSCDTKKTYSYDAQTYCTECAKIISTEHKDVTPLAHTETLQANGSSENHNIYCTACLTVLRTEAHEFTETDVTSTCIAQGYTQKTCECGAEFKDNFKELAPHTFGEYSNLGNNTHTRTCEVCQFEEIETCSFSVTKHDATCTKDGYLTNECTKCHVGSVFPDVYDASTYCSTAYPNGRGSTDVRKTEYRYTGIEEIEKMEVTYTYKLYSYLGWHAWVSAYDESGKEIDTTGSASKDGQSGTRTFTVNGRYFSMNSDNLHNDSYYYYVTAIKVYPKVDKATGHNYVKNNDFGDGLLGTHSCSVCDEAVEHNLDLNRSGNDIVVSCKDNCGFSQVLHTTASTVTVTENNLFDTDKFFQSYTANATNTTSHGLACFRRTDGKAVVIGNGDNYTAHDRENDYIIPVEGGKTYQFDFDASTTYGDVMLFFRGAGVSYDNNYLSMRKSGTVVGTNTIEFTVPEGGKQLYIRIGTNGSGDRNAYCVFSNFALHEKDDPNYRMIKDVPSGSSIDTYLTGSGTEAICHYEFKNSSISFTDGTIANGKTINRNVNVVKSAQHDIYKEFSNGKLAHFYCITCGYNYDRDVEINMVYHESFDDASVSGSTFTSSNGNGTLKNSGTGSIVEYAGIKDKGPRSTNIRHNVLKLNANNTKPGNWMKLDTNPLTDPATAEKAKQEGITISFWRHMEKNGATANLAEDKNDNSGYKWRNALSFEQDGNAANRYYIEVNGVQSRCAVDGQDYTDLIPYYNDNTTKGTPNYTGDWVHIAVTIDPNDKVNGGTLYINGVPREYDLTRTKGSGKYVLSDTMNPGDIAADVINFLTQSNTGFYFNNGDPWEGNDMDMFYDDVRIYTGVMTQLQINQMYGADDSDTPSKESITHDPTNVTVYTLKAGTYTAANGSGDTYVAEAGKTVGEEFINYYGVNVATQVTNIEYYSFGTGMVIEKSSNGYEWEMIGDSKGHFAYQNEDLFGGKYTDVLSEPLNYAKQGASGGGYLLWAPHVMYNLTLNKWVIYESTSSWGSQFSTIFYCTSDTVYKDYAYQGMIHKTNSSSKCNAIDSDVYYGHDANGIIDKDTLYLAYGSYIWNGSQHAIWGRTLTATGENRPGVDSVWKESVDYPLVKADGTSSEGIYVYYVDGYYYMFTTYGSNDYNYTEVYFRSENPNGPFTRYDGVLSTDNVGMYFMSSYHNPVEPYTYWANGHNSAYTVYNKAGEPVLVNAAHSRVLTDGVPQSEEGQIITNQTDIRGNLMISNMMAQTKSGWMVMFPLQYNGTDTTNAQLTAEDVVGTYYVTDNTKGTTNGVPEAYQVTVTACGDDKIFFNGTTFALEYDGVKKITYIVGDTVEGAFAKHGDIIELSFFNKTTLQHTWAYQTAKGDPSTATHTGGEANCTDKAVCDKCHEEYGDALGHNYAVVGDRFVCENNAEHIKIDGVTGKEIDLSVYNSAVILANADVANEAKYTEDSRTALDETVKQNPLDANADTQASVDAKASAITTADKLEADGGVLVLNQYTIIQNLDDDGDRTENIVNETVDYGTSVELTLPAEYADRVVAKWTKTINAETVPVGSTNKTITAVVNSNVEYVVFVKPEAAKPDDGEYVKVSMTNKVNKVSDTDYVKTGEQTVTMDTASVPATVTITDSDSKAVTLEAPSYSFYKVSGFLVDGKKVSEGETVTVTEDTVIKPQYTVVTRYNIVLDDGIKTKNGITGSVQAGWDEQITVTADDADENTKWLLSLDDGNTYSTVSFGKTYTFRVSQGCKISHRTAVEALPTSTLEYVSYDIYKEKTITAVGRYTLPEGYEFVEAGVIIKSATQKEGGAAITQERKDKVNNPANYTVETTSGKYVAKEFVKNTNQYTINVYASATYIDIYIGAKAYLTYKDKNNEVHTVYSDFGSFQKQA